MTHYAKLAAIGFRWISVVVLLYLLPNLIMMFPITRMGGMGHMPAWTIAAVLIHPIIAVVMFVFARPLGEFVAQGFE